MKNIFPIAFNPSNRCGVVASRRAIPAVDNGRVNHAPVKLYANFQYSIEAAVKPILLLEPVLERY